MSRAVLVESCHMLASRAVELLWPPCVIGQAIIFSSCGFFFFLLFSFFLSSFFPRLISWCGLSANLECRSEMCCARLAGNTGRKQSPKSSLSAHHRTTVSGYIFATKARRIDSRKKILKQQYLPHMSLQYMVNFGPLAAEIGSLAWRQTV